VKSQSHFQERTKSAGGLQSESVDQCSEKISRFSVDSLPASFNFSHLFAENQAFAIAVQTAREEEKARLSRELHDELAQSLIVLKMDTIWVRDQVAVGPYLVAEKLDEMVEMLDRTVAATRRMASDLRPLMLDDLGLVPAIEWLSSSFVKRYRVPCRVEVDEEFELHEPYATTLFRIVQESLNNIAKHASASQVIICIKKIPDTINLIVKDDGCGFFTFTERKLQSLGIKGMRERAQLLGGHVEIHSVIGRGTSVEVSLPLNDLGTH